MGDPLLFCHIPKTAGTSVRVALEAVCPDLLEVYEGELRLDDPSAEFLRRWSQRTLLPRVLFGHFSFGVHRFLAVPPRYATFLREPVQRVCSLYRHQLTDPDAPWHAPIAAGMTLGEFVASRRTPQTNNHACRVLAGVPGRPASRVDDVAIAERALGNLREHFVFVGLVEAFADSMRALEKVIGAPLQRPRINVSRRSVAPSRADLDIVRRDNALDILVYESVRSSAGLPERGLDPSTVPLE